MEILYAPATPERPLSLIVYRDSERQARELVERIWTHYYQALADAVDQKPGVSKSLVASITPPAAAESVPGASAASPLDRLAGLALRRWFATVQWSG